MLSVGMPAAALVGLGVVALSAAGPERLPQGKPSPKPAAKAGWTPPRTPWGDPDLEGIWPSTDMVGVPFERPDDLAGRTEVSNEEFATREERAKRQAQSDREEFVSTAPRVGDGTGPPSHWLEWGKPSRQASLVVAPADGKLPPMTPEGQQRSASTKNTYVMFSGFNDVTDMGPYDRCISRGVLGSTFPVIYNNGNQILQHPGYVVIRYEMIHEARIIPMDGRPHLGSGIRMWNGDPRGHWEGNTLVVDTTNFNDKGSIATSAATGRIRGIPHSDALHVIERFTAADANTINYEVTIDDPKVYTKPWKVALPLTRDSNYQMYEYACQEGNYAVPNELSAGRARDKEEAAPKK
jgi:hypothetical protein